jgi:hypothetical protein
MGGMRPASRGRRIANRRVVITADPGLDDSTSLVRYQLFAAFVWRKKCRIKLAEEPITAPVTLA